MRHGLKFHGFNIGLHLHGFLMVFVGPQGNPSHVISKLRMFPATMDYSNLVDAICVVIHEGEI
jgi:hypothetical protein